MCTSEQQRGCAYVVILLDVAASPGGKGKVPSVNDFVIRAAALALRDVPEGKPQISLLFCA